MKKNEKDGGMSVTTSTMYFLTVLKIGCFDCTAAKATVYDINIITSAVARIDDKLFDHKFYLTSFIYQDDNEKKK